MNKEQKQDINTQYPINHFFLLPVFNEDFILLQLILLLSSLLSKRTALCGHLVGGGVKMSLSNGDL